MDYVANTRGNYKKKRKKPQFTYVIAMSDENYKVGKSTNFRRRIKEIRHHVQIKWVIIIRADVEAEIFKIFKEKRYTHEKNFLGHTECLHLNDEDIDFIKDRYKEYLKPKKKKGY